MSDGPEREADSRTPSPGGEGAERIVPEALSLLDSLVEYVVGRFRLEQYRLERRGRALAARVAMFGIAAALVGFGLVFAGWGTALAISDWLAWRPAGPLIIGTLCLVAGLATVLVASRRKA